MNNDVAVCTVPCSRRFIGPNLPQAFYANARSIVNIDKRTELELYVDKEKPDIIEITESWAKESIQDSELELNGYTMFRKTGRIGEQEGMEEYCCI